jgi:signal transduction histidine kinase
MKSIVRTLAVSMGAGALVVFGLSLAATVAIDEHQRGTTYEDCDHFIAQISPNISLGLNGVPQIADSDVLRGVKRRSPTLWYVISAGGQMIEHAPENRPLLPFPLPYLGPRLTGVLNGSGKGEASCIAAIETSDGHPATILISSMQMSAYEGGLAFMQRNLSILALIAVAFAVVASLGVLFATLYMKRSLARVSRLARAIDPQSPKGAIPLTGVPVELQDLVISLNRAFDEIDGFMSQQRHFLGNVAHELRTPLAVIRSKVERIPDHESRTSLIVEIRRLTALLAAMLNLARLDEKSVEMTEINLHSVARDVLADFAPLALDRGIQIEFETQGESTPSITAHEAAIRSAIGNLVANAIAHGEKTSRILAVLTGGRILSISDDGIGIPANFQNQVKDRFQSLTRGADGIGLGLSIVGEIMAAHSGSFQIVPRQGGGVTATLAFPDPQSEHGAVAPA